jgi:hypothetical protein
MRKSKAVTHPITVEHKGAKYSGTYTVESGTVRVDFGNRHNSVRALKAPHESSSTSCWMAWRRAGGSPAQIQTEKLSAEVEAAETVRGNENRAAAVGRNGHALTRRVEDWRGAHMSPFPAPASSNGADGFPVRRSPVCFASWLM